MTVCTRFAPSPTGYLHVGGARTALYCWLFARRHGGKFILRIEDTDRERSTDAAVQAILTSMQWLGLTWDAGPFYQTARSERYQEVLQQLFASDMAYRCECSKERLEQLRAEQLANKQKPKYDGCCRNKNLAATTDNTQVVRFRAPQTGSITFNDLVRGKVVVDNSELDDLILVRSDGGPTYNFTVVVDDIDMQITDVIRGEDHISNTPRQIHLYQALAAKIPNFAHIPIVLGGDGKRLSKRHGAVSVMQYHADGFLPEALLNYLVRLGWSHGDQEIFSVDEMIELFDINAVNKASAIFNTDKLLWLNQHYIKTLAPEIIAKELAWHFQQLAIDTTGGPALVDVVLAQRARAKTILEMAENSKYFYTDVVFTAAAVVKHLQPAIKEPLEIMFEKLSDIDDELWQHSTGKDRINEAVVSTAMEYSLKLGKLAQPLRVALTGDTVSPSIAITIQLCGKGKTLQRLYDAITMISPKASA